ncbi:CLUMA_CG004367, isoform A [Clunio marinus]|uniref:Dymeclin n=1 Tax=Clunio marinus TaxID=568069 RepID=A0A1J1HSY9_9DIPT|nr:CLUMA_CG004367, isoform A [Clunio marinus]
MGINVNVSKPLDVSGNDLLSQFCGKTHISPDNIEFWDSFLKFTIKMPNSSEEQLNLDSRLESSLEAFIQNNLTSGNLGSLITIFLQKASDVLSLNDTESHLHVYKLYNCVFILRVLIKYILEIGSEFLLLQHFEALPRVTEKNGTTSSSQVSVSMESNSNQVKTKTIDGTKFDAVLESIFNIICVIPQKEFTYHLHLECVNVIIVLCSVYLYNQQTTDKSTIFRTIYKCKYASTLLATLLHFVSRTTPAPPTAYGLSNTGGSFVFGLAESFWSMLTFSKKPDALDSDLPKSFKENFPLANQSLLLILILTNHNADDSVDIQNNPYRYSLFNCSNSTELVKDEVGSFKIDFAGLYQTLCKITHLDHTTLLLYLLLHRNEKFYKFVMAQPNLQELVIPILQILYNAPDSSSHHIYMSLIVLLILSEDEGFNKSVHNIMLRNIQWYTERSISEISLGGLLILVIIRTVQYNMLKVRDKYLHTNCLACLANMSSQFRYLHQYVSQRLVSLFETLAKKHGRLQTQLESIKQAETSVVDVTEDVIQDMNVLEEVLRMVLEIINSALSHQLQFCPNLVYTLLYKRHVFESFRSHPAFQDIIQNIDMVIGFFTSRLQRVQDQRGELGVTEVYEVISKGSQQWSSDRLRKFAELRFKYVDEEGNEKSYFLPYIYSLTSKGVIPFSEGEKLMAEV